MLTGFSQSLLRPGGGWAQPFCRAFELHCHFVVKENQFCRMGGLVLLQNEWLRRHPKAQMAGSAQPSEESQFQTSDFGEFFERISIPWDENYR